MLHAWHVTSAPGTEQLIDVVRAGLGNPRRLVDVSALRGGTRKGVYRLTFADESTAVLYVWEPREVTETGPLSEAHGLDLFEAAYDSLQALDVGTPEVYFTDRSRERYPADVALLQDVSGHNLETLFEVEPTRAATTLQDLHAALEVMHSWRGSRIGRLAEVESVPDDAPPEERSCEAIVRDRALRHLTAVADRVPRIAAVADRLSDLLRSLADDVSPRARFGLIHGELGPDHVLVDEKGRPLLIDIEGLMYFDVEWEHAYARIRFHEHYPALRSNRLDAARMRLYALAMHLSLVAGPLHIIDDGFSDRQAMLGIAEHNLTQVLAFLP